MEIFTLSPETTVGNKLLDAQHRLLLSYMSEIYQGLLAGKEESILAGLIERFDSACRLHFVEEERLMREAGREDLEEHARQHEEFVMHLEMFIGKVSELSTTKGVDEILFLKGWFLEHVARSWETHEKRQSK